MKALILLLALLQFQQLIAQPPIHPLVEPVEREASAWSRVEQQIREATNEVEVLERDPARAKKILSQARLAPSSALGAVVQETGGILIDGGWLRLIGSGNERLNRNFYQWNEDEAATPNRQRRARGHYLIADDVLGGLYALNAGHFGVANMGTVYYFSPAALRWQSLEMNYAAFLEWALNGDLDRFYGDQRWKGWRREVRELGGDEAFGFQPFLWSGDQKIAARQRHRMPVEKLYYLHRDGRHDERGQGSKW